MGWAGVIPGMGRGSHAGPRSPLNWPSTPLAEGRGIDGLLSRLIRSGICQLSDVRNNALPHNHDFRGKTMAWLRVEVDFTALVCFLTWLRSQSLKPNCCSLFTLTSNATLRPLGGQGFLGGFQSFPRVVVEN